MNWKLVAFAILIVLIIIIGYYSYLPVSTARKYEFILESKDMGGGIMQQKRFKLHPSEDAVITYVSITGPVFGEKKLGAMKHRVGLSRANIGVNIAFPSKADYGINELELTPPPVYGLARIVGFYRISDGEKVKWIKTIPASTYGNDKTEYIPDKDNLYQLPPPLY